VRILLAIPFPGWRVNDCTEAGTPAFDFRCVKL
jgi:hypothetical protein